jgi:omega-amidase
MNITIIQSHLHWEDVSSNLLMFENKIEKLEKTDLIVLPEMFTTGFSMNTTKLAEKMDGKTIEWMFEMAKKSNSVITGSLIIEEQKKYFNRLIWMKPDGTCEYYDKKHLFSMAKEDEYFSPGSSKKAFSLNSWKICPFICYDLRFPIWNRNDIDYDAALYVANWPQKRSLHWKSLLLARAIENQCYVVAVNRVGMDGKNLQYSGDSSIIDPLGNILFQLSEKEAEYNCKLDKVHLNKIREDFPFLKDRDC